MQKRSNNYNDGIVRFYKKKTDRNVRSQEDLEYLSKLSYDIKTLRQEDVEFAMQNDAKLSVKIVTPDDGNMDTTRVAMIENTVYGIINIDRDKKNRELYFYLQEVRKFD